MFEDQHQMLQRVNTAFLTSTRGNYRLMDIAAISFSGLLMCGLGSLSVMRQVADVTGNGDHKFMKPRKGHIRFLDLSDL